MYNNLRCCYFLLVLMSISLTADDLRSAKRKFTRTYNKNSSVESRLQAIALLTPYDDPIAVRILIKVIDIDSSAEVYNKIIDFLANTQNPKSRKQIYRLLPKRFQIHTTTALIKVCGNFGTPSVDILKKTFRHKAWEVRYATIHALKNIRDKKIVPLLIARFNKETGRLQDETYKALVAVTGMSLPKDHKVWKLWWQGNSKSFSFEDAIDRLLEQKAVAVDSQVQYYKIPIVSNNIIFVLDNSLSMLKSAGTKKYEGDKKITRLDQAKIELIKTLKALPKTTNFNIIEYNGDANIWKKKLVPIRTHREKAIKFVQRLTPQGQTVTYDALEAALAMRQADTLFLLTDGMPVGGKIEKTAKIIEAITNMNKGRNVVINTIGIALPRKGVKFLKKLAKKNQGKYVQVGKIKRKKRKKKQ